MDFDEAQDCHTLILKQILAKNKVLMEHADKVKSAL